MKLTEITAVFLDFIPNELEEGKLYISEKYKTATHLCACGCKCKTITPLKEGEWTMTNNNGSITLSPSIGNFSGENPYHAHYFIRDNKILWH